MKRTFKIETTNGKLTCPELVGYELPEWKRDLEPIEIPKGCHEEFEIGYEVGYRKSREKFEFTESDLRKAYDTNHYSKEEKDNHWNNFIASLRNRTPIAIEVEMAKPSESFGAFVGNVIGEFVPATNPDGTVKVINWIFNN